MSKKYKISAIIAAAGSGVRAGGDLPKQYQSLGGVSMLESSIKAFYNNKLIDSICVVISPEHKPFFDNINKKFDDKIIYAYGGKLRQDSVLEGLLKLKEHKPDMVLIHDGARPFVSEKIINNVVNALEGADAVLPAVKVVDTIKFVDEGIVKKTPDRNNLYSAQTPQGFKYELILNLHEKYKGKGFTDDVALAENDGIEIKIVEGDHANYKVTTSEDINRLAMKNKRTHIGTGFDVHQFEEGDGVILCGIKVPYSKKLKGHSDADCAWHALTDALLGAVGLGDIGEHFPDSDNKWKGADSSVFLKFAAEEIRKKGGEINNVDITIICEEPKLKLHKQNMKNNTAKLLNISSEQVNIKATTTEQLGFLGRKEGLAAQASVSILI
jgi:2-C-methyl-D-erythritol 4-phosphate cytidylyltransferase/2-C-methyl-D-erythritol 2,4-cyclodiphosphate synthase